MVTFADGTEPFSVERSGFQFQSDDFSLRQKKEGIELNQSVLPKLSLNKNTFDMRKLIIELNQIDKFDAPDTI